MFKKQSVLKLIFKKFYCISFCSTGGPFQLPEYFFWNPWQQFHKPGHWKSGLIDSWVILT